MTVSTGDAKAGPYTGNDSASAFAFAFKVFADTDIRVVSTVIATGVESDLVLNTNYTVARNVDQDSSPGGTVTYKVGGVTTALPSTHKLTIVGDFSYEQPTDIPNGGAFFASIVELALDRLTLLVKQVKEKVDRTPQFAVSSSASNIVFPEPSSDKFWGWNAAGDALENKTLGTLGVIGVGVSAGNVQQVDQAVTTVASASTVTLTGTLPQNITGTTPITAFNGVAGVTYPCKAAGALPLTHSAGLSILQTAASVTLSAGATFDVYMVTATTCEVRNINRVGSGYASSVVPSGSAIGPLTSDVNTNITSIPLGEGTWLVTGTVCLFPQDTTSVTAELGGISTVSATLPTSYYRDQHAAVVWGGGSSKNFPVPSQILTLTSPTTVYLVAAASFTVSTCKLFGELKAVRQYI